MILPSKTRKFCVAEQGEKAQCGKHTILSKSQSIIDNKGEKRRGEGEESSNSNPPITFKILDCDFNNNFSVAIKKCNR